MRHGIDAYFLEIARFRRRLSVIGFAVAIGVLGLEWMARVPPVRETLNDPKRFGFEGPEQYVERIRLEQMGEREQSGAARGGMINVRLARGGGRLRPMTSGARPEPVPQREGRGAGASDQTLQAQLRALSLQGPVVRSEDLIAEKLVKPEYPEEARDLGLEGIVNLVAMVDTTGEVTEVHVLPSEVPPVLEQAATRAVLRCRFRPYRVHGSAERVWAAFRISFRLY